MAKEMEKTLSKRRGLVPWRPFAETPTWEREMDRMFGDFFRGRLPSLWNERWSGQRSLGIQEPAVEVYEEKDQVVVKAELPGMSKEDIQVNIADNVLTIRGEKKKQEEKEDKDYYQSELVYGAFVRSIALPTEVNPEKVHATFKNGVLEVRLPKREEAKKKEIKVKRRLEVPSKIRKRGKWYGYMTNFELPVVRYINVEDSEEILRAIRFTDPKTPIDFVLHTPGRLGTRGIPDRQGD